MTAAEDLDSGRVGPLESDGASATANDDSTAHRSLTGDWRGSYDYLGGTGLTSSFTVSIEDDGTQLSGEKIEPDTISGMWAFQIVDGPFEMHRVEICKNI